MKAFFTGIGRYLFGKSEFNKFGVTGTFKGHYDEVSKVGNFTATAPGRTVTGTFDFARL